MGPIQIRGTDLADRRWAAVMARWERAHGTDWSERSATSLYSRGDAAKGLGGNFGTGPESAPPLVVQLWGSSRQTSTATLGSSMGATETKLAMRAPSLALSSFWLVPLLPPMR